ncbi:hypothetical protein Goarm_013710 [Gossypium armourianum]|uniref:Uncharacterized protein n=1 Tax=Gossypium armourianum TaxID=34283 RepID=A0A7J9J444_9ROSI|nr:hypothetical protein [Gossypium armourianum]
MDVGFSPIKTLSSTMLVSIISTIATLKVPPISYVEMLPPFMKGAICIPFRKETDPSRPKRGFHRRKTLVLLSWVAR